MACIHHYGPTEVSGYQRCIQCGTYCSIAPEVPEKVYAPTYWGDVHSVLHEQAWNVDMHLEDGKSKNGFVLERIAAARGSALEIGCAPGRLLYWLTWAARFAEVVGIDPANPDAIRSIGCFDGELWTGLFPESTRDVPGGRFDYVVGLDVFEHSLMPAPFLMECARLLKPKGQLFLMLPLADNLLPESRFFLPREHAFLHSRANMAAMLQDAGFNDIKYDAWTTGHDTVSSRKPS